MHALIYLMLLAGPCLGHYYRNLVERDDLQRKGEWVECPVCETPSDSPLASNEVCELHDGKSAKLCLYGIYLNKVCGNRWDCYRGPGEQCTQKLDNDDFGQRCAPNWSCSRSTGRCTGLGNHYKIGQLDFINSDDRYLLGDRRHIKSINSW